MGVEGRRTGGVEVSPDRQRLAGRALGREGGGPATRPEDDDGGADHVLVPGDLGAQHPRGSLGRRRRPGPAESRRDGEPVLLDRLELAGSVADLGDEGGIPPLELEVEPPRLEQVRAAEDHLVHVERLGQEVLGPGGERPGPRRPVHVAGQEHDREVRVGGETGADRLQGGEPVEARHMHIEEHEVGLVGTDRVDGRAGIHEPRHAADPRPLDDPLQELDVQGLVVDDDDPGDGGFGWRVGRFGRAFGGLRCGGHGSPGQLSGGSTRV